MLSAMRLLYLIALVASLVPLLASAQLKVGFYSASCPQAESVVRRVVTKRLGSDRSIVGAFLRLYFHDCFSNGCDASLLIDAPPANRTEKEDGPNFTVRGYDVIAEIKSALEAKCPSTVSCADVIALATRDAVALSGGPDYAVPTGRRDAAALPTTDILPGPGSPMPAILTSFRSQNFTPEEAVVLLGAHTVGRVHCFFLDLQDPSMDKQLAAKLRSLCAKNGTAFTSLDQATPFTVDGEFYGALLKKKGVLGLDRRMATDATTAPIVQRMAADPEGFLAKFGRALVKLGSVGVLVGTQGEIRTNCSAFN